MAKIMDLKLDRTASLDAAEAIVNKAAAANNRELTAEEAKLFESHMSEVKRLDAKITAYEDSPNNSLMRMVRQQGGPICLMGGDRGARPENETGSALTAEEGHIQAAAFRSKFTSFVNNTLRLVGGGSPQMEAAAPSGPISIGSGVGEDSIGITMVPSVLPFLPSYWALDSFGLAGCSQIYTDHTRPLVKPIISAGAADADYAENAAPTTSQPFGLSSFTFGGQKVARLVLASYESLMNSELPLQGVILDELLASIATTLTTNITTLMNAALTAASSSLAVAGGDTYSIYGSMIELRHAVPPRFDRPDNKWMLSRATLAQIRNTRASTSGVPMFDPNSNLIFGHEYVINDNFDSICGAGFVVYGNWADGMWIRKTPLMTRVFLELYAQNGQVGFRTQQWYDAHLLAELAGAAQPPTNQALYYTSLVGEGNLGS